MTVHSKPIMVDVDDTIAEMMSFIVNQFNKMGHDVSYEDMTGYGKPGELFGDKPFLDMVEKNFLNFEPISAIVEEINYIASFRPVVIATNRGYSDNAYEHTVQWLKDNDVWFDELHVVNGSKADYFKALGYRFSAVVEDKGETVEEMIDKDVTTMVFMVDRPWNQWVDVHHKITRVKTTND